jgi:hypothetical protein
MGGLSQALTAADPTSKKRPLTKQASLPCLDSPEAEQSPHHKPQRLRSALHHQVFCDRAHAPQFQTSFNLIPHACLSHSCLCSPAKCVTCTIGILQQLSELQGHQQPLQSNNDNGMPPVPEPSCQPAAPQPTCRIPAGAPIPEESGQVIYPFPSCMRWRSSVPSPCIAMSLS